VRETETRSCHDNSRPSVERTIVVRPFGVRRHVGRRRTLVRKESQLASKVWRQVSPTDAPLATLYIFLRDGTLVQTSCREVYRLSMWRADGDRTLVITEDATAQYAAEFEAEGDRRLRLRFKLGGEWQPWKTLEA
jgi:hypothetical protein